MVRTGTRTDPVRAGLRDNCSTSAGVGKTARAKGEMLVRIKREHLIILVKAGIWGAAGGGLSGIAAALVTPDFAEYAWATAGSAAITTIAALFSKQPHGKAE